jgi:sphingomyelin phosphodiesterase acid-like 3
MKRHTPLCTFRTFGCRLALLAFLFLCAAMSHAQGARPAATGHARPVPAKSSPPTTVAALLVSDIHFEPFWDPEKAAQLDAAPVTQWNAILAAAPSSGREQRFDALQQTCHARGVDTSYPLLESSLQAMRGSAAGIRFVTVSGDLIAHAFDCKYRTLFPHSTADAYRTFVEKTIGYVVAELNGISPGVPVFVALGNNDSDCGDYRLDARSEFLAATGRQIVEAVPAAERDSALKTFAEGGYYSVPLPAPIRNARLLVLNDIFLSGKYTACSGKPNPGAADGQLAWLQQQLDEARAQKQNLWVMGHIPPGIDAHASKARMIDPCGGASPKMFLSNEKLADMLTDHSGVVKLALFAHTHMDEIRLLRAEPAALSAAAPGRPTVEPGEIALKTVPSISPIDGNNPSFTIAQVDSATATLVDYRVIAAANPSGSAWSEEYDYSRAYGEPSYSAASVDRLLTRFAADSNVQLAASQNYLRSYLVGGGASALAPFWPQYVCTLTHHTAAAFGACACPVAH